MSESTVIKLTQEEIDEVRKIQEGYRDTIFSLGKLYLHRLNMESAFKELSTTEESLQKKMDDLQKSESSWTEKISKKYGDGNLDMEKGEFIPLSNSST